MGSREPNTDDVAGDADSSVGVHRVDQYHWETDDGVEYILTDIPTAPCHKCGAEIGEDQYCYFRDDDGLDHVCWDCGQEVTGFGD